MEILIEVTYMAIAWDNYQGHSGKPFTNRVTFRVDDEVKVYQIQDRVDELMAQESEKQFIGEVRVLEVKMLNTAVAVTSK